MAKHKVCANSPLHTRKVKTTHHKKNGNESFEFDNLCAQRQQTFRGNVPGRLKTMIKSSHTRNKVDVVSASNCPFAQRQYTMGGSLPGRCWTTITSSRQRNLVYVLPLSNGHCN